MRPTLIAIFVVWTAYPLGLALAAGHRSGNRVDLRVRSFDLLLFPLIAFAVVWFFRLHTMRTSLLWAIPVTLLIAALTQLVPSGSDETGLAGEYSYTSATKLRSRSPLRRIWNRWIHITEIIANFQVRLLFSYIYLVVLLPWGMWYRFNVDPLSRRAPAETLWQPASPALANLEDARRQF